MIVYVASYPRSGNFWLQTLLGNQFKRPTTRMHSRRDHEGTFKAWVRQNKRYYDIDVFKPAENLVQDYLELAPWVTCFTFSSHDKTYKALMPGCVNHIKQTHIREHLANDDEIFFVKTHLPPYPDYFEGEYVIQAVRNPGASIWSYYNYRNDIQHIEKNTLDGAIQGGVGYGDWSDYHKKWIAAARRLDSRYLQVRYEDLFNRELEFCERVREFLSLEIFSREIRSFDYYHQMRPALTRKGKSSGWEENYSQEQLKLLWQVHGELMTHFGYPEPKYELGLEKEIY